MNNRGVEKIFNKQFKRADRERKELQINTLADLLQHITKKGEKNKLAYICSPYRGNIFQRIRNIRYARQLTRNAIRLGFAPIATHLYLTQVLNDEKPTERIEGMTAALNILLECGVLIVGTRYGVSIGMKTEIEFARLNGITTIWILGGTACYTL